MLRLRQALLRPTARALSSRRASTAAPYIAKAELVLPDANNEEDPQLAGLGYPQFKGQSRQLREAKKGWWDEQDRLNPEETLSENDDVQTMWGPDAHNNFPGPLALKYLSVASVVMAASCYMIYVTKPDRPLEKRSYPYDGLKLEMNGRADSPFAAARSDSAAAVEEGEGADEEE